MNLPPLHITRQDHTKLRLLLAAIPRSATNPNLEKLRNELDRATIIDTPAVSPDIVTMGARVKFEDLGDGEQNEYTLTFPEHANINEGRLSILAPVGMALIGFREGDTVDWPTPGGMRRLKIHRVTQAHELASAS